MTPKATRDGSMPSHLAQRRRSANEMSNESYAAKQREITEAAARLFAEKGYESTNFGDIAKAVKMDRATLYYYFTSKVQLLGSAIIDALSGAVKELNEIVASDTDALSKLRAAISCLLTAMVEEHPFVALTLQDDIWRSPRNSTWIEPLRKDYERIVKVFNKIIEGGQRDGTIRDDVPAELVSRVVFGSVVWSYRWFKPAGRYSAEEVIHSFDAILSVGVAPLEGPPQRRHKREPASRRDTRRGGA